MPEEFSRTTARKRITLPHGGTVDVPVITKISFIDPFHQHQEWQYDINNSAEGARKVHVDEVPSVANPDGPKLPVERIDKWSVIDPISQSQETELEFDNVTGAQDTPPHFSTHTKTHVKRYTNELHANVWIESELIDEFTVIDPITQYQETLFTLINTDQPANQDDPDIADSGNGIDPPWRTDPFQNIIGWNDVEQPTGDFPARVSYWVASYLTWSMGTVQDPTRHYISSVTPFIEDGVGDSINPDHLFPPKRWGLFWHGAAYRPLTGATQTRGPENEVEDAPQPTTIISSFSGTSFTQSAIIFNNGQAFDGAGTYDFSAVTADYIHPNAEELANDPALAGYVFPFPGGVRDIHFVCETISDNINYPGPELSPPGIPTVWFIDEEEIT